MFRDCGRDHRVRNARILVPTHGVGYRSWERSFRTVMQQGFADAAAAVHAYAKLSGDIYGSGKFRANNCIAARLGPGLLAKENLPGMSWDAENEAGALNPLCCSLASESGAQAFVVRWHDDAEDVDSEEQMITPPRGIWFDAAQQLWRVSANRLKDNDYLWLPCLHVSLDFWRVSSLICQWPRPALGPRGSSPVQSRTRRSWASGLAYGRACAAC